MAHSKNFNERQLEKYSIKRTEKGININVNFAVLGSALDKAQLALDRQVWNDMRQYMPWKSGMLVRQTNQLNAVSAGTGEVHVYDPLVPYAHYQYEGEKYIDPIWRVGGFYGIIEGKEGQWWSRKGITKIPSGEPLHYGDQRAQSHWDDVAIEKHSQEWLDLVRKVLENNVQ